MFDELFGGKKNKRYAHQGQRGSGSVWQKIMIFAPIVLQILSAIRQNQKNKRGAFTKTRKREKVFDFALDQANRWVNGRGRSGGRRF